MGYTTGLLRQASRCDSFDRSAHIRWTLRLLVARQIGQRPVTYSQDYIRYEPTLGGEDDGVYMESHQRYWGTVQLVPQVRDDGSLRAVPGLVQQGTLGVPEQLLVGESKGIVTSLLCSQTC